MFDNLRKDLLVKITTANTILVVVRMSFSVILQKILAIFIGAEGFALVGNFKNVINFLEQFSVLGTFNGIVKFTSEFKDNKNELNKIFSTSLSFATISALISFLILFFGSRFLNDVLFGVEYNYVYVFKILAFIVPFMSLNAVLNGIVNGKSQYKVYNKVSFTTIIVSTLLIVFFTIKSNVEGTLIAICLTPIVQFFAFISFYAKFLLNDISFTSLSFSKVYKNKFLSYSLMTIIVILSINIGDIFVRNLIQEVINKKEAGYWTAMTSVSKIYMQFTAVIFPLYILPKYASITKTFEFRQEVFKIYKLLVPVFLLGIVIIFILKTLIIQLLYTEDFLNMSVLFKWQLLGDFIKLCSLIISYHFLAKRRIGYFIFTELLSVLLFCGFSDYLIHIYGTEGVVFAHFIRYIIYFLVAIFILRHKLFGINKTL